jgi:hypothetical protein
MISSPSITPMPPAGGSATSANSIGGGTVVVGRADVEVVEIDVVLVAGTEELVVVGNGEPDDSPGSASAAQAARVNAKTTASGQALMALRRSTTPHGSSQGYGRPVACW